MGNLINRLLCFLDYHDGIFIGKGNVIVTSKRKKSSEMIPGIWVILRCKRPHCKLTYAIETTE